MWKKVTDDLRSPFRAMETESVTGGLKVRCTDCSWELNKTMGLFPDMKYAKRVFRWHRQDWH